MIDNNVQFCDINYLHGNKNGTFYSSLDEHLNLGTESAGNRDPSESFDSKCIGVDHEDHDVDLDAKLFEDNVVEEEEEVGNGNTTNLFGQDKEWVLGILMITCIYQWCLMMRSRLMENSKRMKMALILSLLQV